MRLSIPSFAAGAAVALVLAAVPATAVVGAMASDAHPTTYDGTSPSFTLNPVEFVVGSSIDAADADTGDCGSTPWNLAVPLRLRWTASDATSGIAGYDVWGTGAAFDGNDKLVSDTTSTTYAFNGFNYDADCGGGSAFDKAYWVVARDNRGNTASSGQVDPFMSVWQETGAGPTGEAGLPLTKTGTWTAASCTCFNNGKTLYSTASGASLSYKVTATGPGQTVALVMEKASNRGTANISVDGGTATAVSTNGATTHRVIVWQKALSVGTHTVKVSNAGTAGHSRIDVDAVMLTGPQTGSAPPEPITP